jgi:flagellar basal-body rod modification protein FlgD
MSTISALATQAANTIASTSAAQPAIGEEFNSFLKLLTAQMRNQDPLAPLDSTQFVEQLATFSALEQQVQSNSSLETIAAMMNDMTGLLASQWIGQTVSFEASNIPFTGNEINFAVDAPGSAKTSVLTIKDSNGQPVWSGTLDPETVVHSWDGRLASGAYAIPGQVYTFTIDNYDAANVRIGSVSPQLITTVTAISSEDGVLIANTAAQISSQLGLVTKLS